MIKKIIPILFNILLPPNEANQKSTARKNTL